MSSAIEIIFGGHRMVLDASGALYWAEERILVTSDLHFEKASFLARHGSFIAPYDTLDTLERLEAIIRHYAPRELILLGDSFHDRQAWERLDGSLRGRLIALTRTVAHCHWIEGNHDVLLAHELPAFEAEYIHRGVLFRHEHVHTSLPQVIGHYHPKASISLRGQFAKGPCFIYDAHLLVMPAFGSFTGGLAITDKVFTSLFSEPAQACLIHRDSIYKL